VSSGLIVIGLITRLAKWPSRDGRRLKPRSAGIRGTRTVLPNSIAGRGSARHNVDPAPDRRQHGPRHFEQGPLSESLVIAADRKQARVIMRYCTGLLRSVPMLSQIVLSERSEAFDLCHAHWLRCRTW
jgi:hypothetical protein